MRLEKKSIFCYNIGMDTGGIEREEGKVKKNIVRLSSPVDCKVWEDKPILAPDGKVLVETKQKNEKGRQVVAE